MNKHRQSNSLRIGLVVTGMFLIFFRFLHGQGRNEEITIIAPYIPSIQAVSKIPFRPELDPVAPATEHFDFGYLSKSVDLSPALDPIEPLRFSDDQKKDLSGNYIKAGFGNYLTPYLEFLAGSKPSEKYFAGARIKHHSSQGGIQDHPTSAFSHNLVSASGSAFFKRSTLGAAMGYTRDVIHYYGFQPDSFPDLEMTDDNIRQRYQHLWLSVDFTGRSRSQDRLQYRIGSGFHFFNDRYESREIEFDFTTGINKMFPSGGDFRHSLGADLSLMYMSYSDSISGTSPLIIHFFPLYRFGTGPYRFEAGLDLYVISNQSSGKGDLQADAFPRLRIDISLIEGRLEANAMVSGTKTIGTFRSMTGINPYLTSTPIIRNTDEQIKVSGGLNGNAGGLNFNADLAYSYNHDMPFLVNDTAVILQNKFQAVYDDVNLFQIRAGIGYLKIRKLEIRLLGSYFHYIPKNELKAWHLPAYEVGWHAGYVFREKFTLKSDFMVLGSRYARIFKYETAEAYRLKPAFDLNVGFEYRITGQLSGFLTVNNLLNQHYQRWYQYPVQGIQGMLGVTFIF